VLARDLLRAHRETYRIFWKWSDQSIDFAVLPYRPVLTAKQRRQRKRFVMVPLEWALATGENATFVTIWLLYRAWETKSNTVVLSTGQLEAYGISRWSKQRALRKLETAGLIEVRRQHGRAPVVTMLHEFKDGADTHG
jgi:hypothetical protein